MLRHRAQLLVPLLCAALGCTGDDATQSAAEQDRGPRPEVNLPPVPQIDVDRPMQHADGSLTVWALSQRMSEHLGQQVRVTAYAQEIYVCEHRERQQVADRMVRERVYLTQAEIAAMEAEIAAMDAEREGEEAEGEEAEGTGDERTERCLYPHMFVGDSVNAERRLLVTGYGVPLERRLRVGDQYLLEGRFLEETRGFSAPGRGLIYVFNITGGSLDLPEEADTEADSLRLE